MDSTFQFSRPSPPPSHPTHTSDARPSSSSGPRPSSSSSYAQPQPHAQPTYRPTSSHAHNSISPTEYRPMSSGGPTYAPPFGHALDAQPAPAEGGWRDQSSVGPAQPPTSLDPSQLAQTAYVQNPYGGFTPVPPHPGANLRNTRPMTAPSSLAPPYFHSNHHHQPTQGMYAVQEYSAQPPPAASAFQYHVDNGGQYGPSDDDQQQIESRERGFSLPELVGVQDDHPYIQGGDAVDQERRRYSTTSADDGSPSNSTFFYAPPPQVRGQAHQAQHSFQTDDSDYRRPTTGNSSSGGPARSSHHNVQHHDPYGRPLSSHYDDDYEENHAQQSGSGGKTYNFVSQAGHASKRPRRRFDEIERLYTCDYPGCSKAYGTLNHLNSHKTMQKHGPRSTPAQFKELRKAWRDNKKQQAAALARGEVPPPSLIPAAAELKAMGRQRSQSNATAPSAGYMERARPSTSAGEYHSAVPAFMTTGTPIQAVSGAAQVNGAYGSLQLPPPPAGMTASPYPVEEVVANPGQLIGQGMYQGVTPQPGWGTSFDGYAHPQESAYSPHRPVTAPSIYSGVPAFGYAPPHASAFQAAGLAQRPDSTGVSPFGYMPQGGIQAPQPRRLSLPLVGAPGSETKFGHAQPFGAIQEEVGLVGGEEER